MLHTPEANLVKLKVSSEARSAEEERTQQRKKNCLVLCLDFLQTHGYNNTVISLESESNVSLRKIAAADNMDLMTILQEFESFYNFKFQRVPKLTRRVNNSDNNHPAPQSTTSTSSKSISPSKSKSLLNTYPTKPPSPQDYPPSYHNHHSVNNNSPSSSADQRLPGIKHPHPMPKRSSVNSNINNNSLNSSTATLVDGGGSSVNIIGQSISSKSSNTSSSSSSASTQKPANIGTASPFANFHDNTPVHDDLYENRLLKPMPGWGQNAEMKELAAIISRDIFLKNPNVKWDDIAGLSTSKQLVKEAVVLPLKYPELFTGILTPWKGLLLYGPPGTGKTMLAKAVATECKTTFFNISASSIVSKWRGDSEKLVRTLFELARYHAPSTIFLDELESIMSHRASEGGGGGGQEHEGSRRMKTELLIQMDGLAKSNDHVFLLAASNLPWELDVAMLRRLEKRILIGLPDKEARKAMFEKSLPPDLIDGFGKHVVDEENGLDYEELADLTHGYSGSDINLVCKEAAMRPLRKLFSQLDKMNMNNADCSNINNNNNASESSRIILNRDPVTQQDVEMAITTTKPSCDLSLEAKYLDWESSHGSV